MCNSLLSTQTPLTGSRYINKKKNFEKLQKIAKKNIKTFVFSLNMNLKLILNKKLDEKKNNKCNSFRVLYFIAIKTYKSKIRCEVLKKVNNNYNLKYLRTTKDLVL